MEMKKTIIKFSKVFPLATIAFCSVFFIKNGLSAKSSNNLNPGNLTRAHLELYEKIEKKTLEVNEKEKLLKEKELVLDEKENRITIRLKQLKKANTLIKQTLNELSNGMNETFSSLLKAVESMKPEEAGKILKSCEISTLFVICKHMNPLKLSKIMGFLDPTQAQAILQFSVIQSNSLKNNLPAKMNNLS
jgi:flagellar motility protein MotE (MotC chaperone)